MLFSNLLVLTAGLHVGNGDKALTGASEYENDIDELQENSVKFSALVTVHHERRVKKENPTRCN